MGETMKRILVVAGLVVLAFLIGFIPTQIRMSRLQADYRECRLHRLAGLVMIEAQLSNYGIARERASEFFDAVRDAAAASSNSQTTQRLNTILARRDEIIADLTAMRPEVASKLRGIFIELPNPDAGREPVGKKS